MKVKPSRLLALIIGSLLLAVTSASAQTSPLLAQLHALQAKVQARETENLKKGPGANIPRKWSDIIQAFDALLAAHKNEKTDDVAQVALAKAMLNAEPYRHTGNSLLDPGVYQGGVFSQDDLCIADLQQVIKDYPETPTARQADDDIQSIQQAGFAPDLAARRKLIGEPLPDFSVTDYTGVQLSPARFQGKVVLLDYWGTDCAPCLLEMANVAKVYAQYRAQGFVVVGVTRAIGFGPRGTDPKTLNANLTAFLKKYNMTWPQYCAAGNSPRSPLGLNELFDKFHVTVLPDNFLIGRDGKIIAMHLFGDDLTDAVAKAVAGK